MVIIITITKNYFKCIDEKDFRFILSINLSEKK